MEKYIIDGENLSSDKNFIITNDKGEPAFRVVISKKPSVHKRIYEIFDNSSNSIGKLVLDRYLLNMLREFELRVKTKNNENVKFKRIIEAFEMKYIIEGNSISIQGDWTSAHFSIFKANIKIAEVETKDSFIKVLVTDQDSVSLSICLITAISFIKEIERF